MRTNFVISILVVALAMLSCSTRRPAGPVQQSGSTLEYIPGIRSASQLNALTLAALGVNPPTDFPSYQQLLARISNGQTTSTTTRQGNLDHSALACGIVVQRESAMNSSNRKIFVGVDFNSGPDQMNGPLLQGVAHTLFARSLGRPPTREELSSVANTFGDIRMAVKKPGHTGWCAGRGCPNPVGLPIAVRCYFRIGAWDERLPELVRIYEPEEK